MTLRDKIAEAVREAIDSVHDMDVTFDDYARASADAILDVIREGVLPLEWSEPQPPKGGNPSFYDHVVADTVLGPVMLEWKSWKKYDDPGTYTPWNSFVTGSNLDEAKAAVQSDYARFILSALGIDQ